MVIVVCGDRDWKHGPEPIRSRLKAFPTGTVVLHGDCRGVDKIAGKVAEQLGFTVDPYPADWDALGKAAGPARNAQMIAQRPKLVIAFHYDPGLGSGTRDCVRQALAAGIRVEVHLLPD